MKHIIRAGCLALLLGACKKENATDLLTARTEKNKALLFNTEWYGLYRNIGEEGIGNNAGFRGYAIALGADDSFTFYGAGFIHPGVWTVNGDTVGFKFTDGVQNQWKFNLKNDSLFSGVTLPVPNNFILDKNLKKIAVPPADLTGHVWTDAKLPGLNSMVIWDNYLDSREGITGLRVYYDFLPVKKKIFGSTVEVLNYCKLIVVDGKTAWVYNRSANNYQYNY